MNTPYPVPDSCCTTDYPFVPSKYCGLEYAFDNVTDVIRPLGENMGCADRVSH